MNQCRVKTSRYQPDQVAEKTEAAGIAAIAYYFFAKREQNKPGQFKALESPGYANNCNTENKAPKEITQCSEKTTKDQPDKIAQ